MDLQHFVGFSLHLFRLRSLGWLGQGRGTLDDWRCQEEPPADKAAEGVEKDVKNRDALLLLLIFCVIEREVLRHLLLEKTYMCVCVCVCVLVLYTFVESCMAFLASCDDCFKALCPLMYHSIKRRVPTTKTNGGSRQQHQHRHHQRLHDPPPVEREVELVEVHGAQPPLPRPRGAGVWQGGRCCRLRRRRHSRSARGSQLHAAREERIHTFRSSFKVPQVRIRLPSRHSYQPRALSFGESPGDARVVHDGGRGGGASGCHVRPKYKPDTSYRTESAAPLSERKKQKKTNELGSSVQDSSVQDLSVQDSSVQDSNVQDPNVQDPGSIHGHPTSPWPDRGKESGKGGNTPTRTIKTIRDDVMSMMQVGCLGPWASTAGLLPLETRACIYLSLFHAHVFWRVSGSLSHICMYVDVLLLAWFCFALPCRVKRQSRRALGTVEASRDREDTERGKVSTGRRSPPINSVAHIVVVVVIVVVVSVSHALLLQG